MNDYQAGTRVLSLSHTSFMKVEIGARPIYDYKEDSSLKNNILTFMYFWKSVVEFFILMFISPFFIGYLIYRIGLKKSIKLFKRIDKKHKLKKVQ